ncbi:MAG: anhydro-N-acetylmuramic acid kinase [Saprospiraceae bacterium]|nr:anhydro-N-acetylmuramic acid kinase [Saprospiraceae bacterium]
MNVLGLMSGTSLDGLDMALIRFKETEKLQFEFLAAKTIPYTEEWKSKLSNAFYADPDAIQELDRLYGIWLAEQVLVFKEEFKLPIDLIGSHGHTVFHRPHEGLTLQIGSGQEIYRQTGIPVVCNFRQQDVALGGQGAPLVPIGDEMLFSEFDFCLNLGGFSNISWNANGQREACDLSPCNMLLNSLSQKLGKTFDEGGKLAQTGKILNDVFKKWNALGFYQMPFPKSLGREWYLQNFEAVHLFDKYEVIDLLRTAVEHIAFQIHHFIETQISRFPERGTYHASVLCTGGGAYNDFLLERLNALSKTDWHYHIPNSTLIDYKEAMVFALLAYLKWNDRVNVLSSVTGALHDHSSGDVYEGLSRMT